MTPLTAPTRTILWITGLAVFSVGIALTIWSGWGVGSVDLAITGVVERSGAHLRIAVLTVHAAAIGIAMLLGEKLRWPTIVASLAASAIISSVATHLYAISDGPSTAAAPVVCILGIVLLGVGAGAQIVASVGPSPFEMLTEALARHTRGLTTARTIAEICFAITGVLLGGQLGWGTIVAVAVTGVIINLTYQALTAAFTNTQRPRPVAHPAQP